MTLVEAYRETLYRVTLPSGGTADVRVGRPSPALDAALVEAGAAAWGFVTASNPAPRTLSRALNARRLRALWQRAGRGGRPVWPAVGLGHSGGPSERGVVVLAVSEGDLIGLGRAFGQLAVVCGRLGEVARLVVDSGHAMSDHAPLDARLDALRQSGATDALRRFAADAALLVLRHAPGGAPPLVDAAERAARGEAVDLGALRSRFGGTATAAGTIGLRHGAANAPAFLAAYAACAPDAYAAATGAARMVRRHGELAGLDADDVERDLSDLLPADS